MFKICILFDKTASSNLELHSEVYAINEKKGLSRTVDDGTDAFLA
jgi:hypothetical protein